MKGSRQRMYPEAPRAEVVDDYFGRGVPDPFRPPEQANRPDTFAWVEAQNVMTGAHLDLPMRSVIRQRLEVRFEYERFGVPDARAGRLFLAEASGRQKQPIWSVRERDGAEREILDPNGLSDDGTAAIPVFS